MYENEDQYEPSEFECAIADLINAEVETRLKGAVEGIDKIREDYKNSHSEIYKLENKIRELDSTSWKKDHEIQSLKESHEKEIKTIKDEYGKDYLSKAFGNWKSGGRAYRIKDSYSNANCPNCKGVGKTEATLINGDKTMIECGFCNGKKQFELSHKWVDDDYIQNVSMCLNDKGKPVIELKVSGYLRYTSECSNNAEPLTKKCEEFNQYQLDNLNERFEKFKSKLK